MYSMPSVETLKKLPYPREPYIYYLLHEGVVVYVGQSKNYINRLKDHSRDKEFDCFCVSKPDPKLSLNECEFMEIIKYLPKYNNGLPGVGFLLCQTDVYRICGLTSGGAGDKTIFDYSVPDYTIPVGERVFIYWSVPGHEYQNETLRSVLETKSRLIKAMGDTYEGEQ